MAKRKSKQQDLEKKKKLKQSQDEQLSTGLFNNVGQGQHQGDDDDKEGDEIDWDNQEMDYELIPRKITTKKTIEALPIKKSDGTIERVVREVEEEEEKEELELENDVENEPSKQENKENKEEKDIDTDDTLTPQEKLIQTKEEIAELGSKLIEDPEENIVCLTRLRKMSESKNFMTSQLSILALIPIFKSLAPSYKIRPLTDTEKREKVSREIAKLRNFEQNLVINYKAYIELLTKYLKISYSNSMNNNKITSDQLKRGNIALKAATELCLSSLRHFNFREELFTIIIKRLNKKPQHQQDYPIFIKSLRVLETLLKDDAEHGDITFDIIKIMTKSIKDKKFRVDESVVNVFLSISLLEDYDPNNNNNNKDDHHNTTLKPKLKKKDRIHLSKKERKARKERKEIEEEIQKAEQAITVEQREKYQAQVLKMVLTLYLEILKAGSSSSQLIDGDGKKTKNDASLLMGAVLEGLSSGDNDNDNDDESGGMYSGNELRTILLCIATSFSLVLNHNSMGKLPMAIDLSKFVSTLYIILTDLALDPDLEFSHKTLRLADPLSSSSSSSNELENNKPAVNVSTKAELLLRCLDFIFFRSKNGTIPRATAFIKRLYILTLQTPEKTSLANLKFIGKLMNRYGENIKGLWNTEERISGEGNYILGIERQNKDKDVELERSNSGAATLWENVLLDKHYSIMIKDGSRSLMKNSKANTN